MKFFNRYKRFSDPEVLVSNSLQFLLTRITDDLEREAYHWDKPWGVKRYESMILAKFILDYSFENMIKDQLLDEEKNGYYHLSNTSFQNLFNSEFSEVGINFKDLQKEITKKVEDYLTVLKGKHDPPECYHQVYMLITGSRSHLELGEEIKKKTTCLEFIRTNDHFVHMVPQYEIQIRDMMNKVSAFDLAGIMLPHMIRSAKQKIKDINIKKIKSLSKKLANKDKKK